MPDVSKLSLDEQEAYYEILAERQARKDAEATAKSLPGIPAPKVVEGLKKAGNIDPLTGIRYNDDVQGARAPGHLNTKEFGKGAANLLLGVATGGAGPALKHMSGLKGLLASAGIGAAEGVGTEAIRALGGENVSPSEVGVSAGMGAVLPVGAKGLQSSVAKNGYAKARSFLSDLLGKEVEPTNISKLPGVTTSQSSKVNSSPMARVFAQTKNNAVDAEALRKTALNDALATGQQLKDREGLLKAHALKLKNSIDAAKRVKGRGVGKLEAQFQAMEDEYTAPGIDEAIKMAFGESDAAAVQQKFASGFGEAMENKANILAARKQIQAAKTGQLKIPDGPLDAEVPTARIETLEQNMGKTKEAMLQARLDAERYKNIDLPKLVETVKKSSAVDPRIQPFLKAGTPSEFLEVLKSTNHENVATLRGQLTKPAQKALEDTFSSHFAQLAAGADGQLTGIEAAAKAFPKDKIAAIYGGGDVGRLKSEAVQTVVDDVRRMLKSEHSSDTLSGMAKNFAIRSVAGVPFMLVRMNHGSLPVQAAVAGASVAAVSFPKLIDYAVRSPAFGRQFQKFAAEHAVEGAVVNNPIAVEELKKFPLVEEFFRENNKAPEYKPGKPDKPVDEGALQRLRERVEKKYSKP